MTNLFGQNYDAQIAPLCDYSPPLGQMICDTYFSTNPAEFDSYLREESVKAFEHLHQNAIQKEF